MALLDRLRNQEEPHISGHRFYGAMVGLADGTWTRSEIETFFGLSTTGQDKAQLDKIINGYLAAADKGRYLTAVHAIGLLVDDADYTLSNAEIDSWLTAAEAAY
jgi:hypothetical protein